MAYWLWHFSERREPELRPVLQGLLTDFVQAAAPTAAFLHVVMKAQLPFFLLPPARHSVLSQRVRHCRGKRELWAWVSSFQRRSSAHTPLHGDCSDHQAKNVGPPLLQALLCLQCSFCEEMGYHRALAITQRP